MNCLKIFVLLALVVCFIDLSYECSGSSGSDSSDDGDSRFVIGSFSDGNENVTLKCNFAKVQLFRDYSNALNFYFVGEICGN